MALQRTQILLDSWQHSRLKELARERRTTLSDLVRQMVEQGLEKEMGPPKGITEMIGTIQDGTWDPQDVDKELYGSGD